MTDATPDADLHEAPQPRSLPPKPAEAHAVEVARGIAGERIVCTSQGRAQAAESLATERPAACVTAWFLDLYPAGAGERDGGCQRGSEGRGGDRRRRGWTDE